MDNKIYQIPKLMSESIENNLQPSKITNTYLNTDQNDIFLQDIKSL